jgi:hypothetical protein
MRFFAKLCYEHAEAVKSPLRRLMAYLIVFGKFDYRYLPPSIRRFLHRNRLRGQKVKNSIKQALAIN